MILKTKLFGRLYEFKSVKEVLAKANEYKSGDQLAGVAAESAEERVAAKVVLAQLKLSDLFNNPVVPYEEDEVTRIIIDDVNLRTYEKIKNWTVEELREWILDNKTKNVDIQWLSRGLTSEMVAAVAKLMTNLDLIVAANPGENQAEQDKLKKLLADGSIAAYQEIHSETLTEKYKGKKETESVTLMVTDKENFEPFISLESPDNQQKLTLKDGVVVSDKLARIAGVSPGGSIELGGKSVKLAAVNENHFGHFAFMKATDYQKIYGKKPEKNAYLVRLKDSSSKNIVDKANEFMSLKSVKSVSQNASMVKQFNVLANSLNNTMMILVLISILLAVVILYNLTNINVAERIRELSTIKVLGFHNKEVTLYIYRETIILSVIGMAVGLLGGFFLHRFLIEKVAPSIISLNPQVSPSVYLFPLTAVTLILTLLGFFVNYRLRRVDMLEALKSVD